MTPGFGFVIKLGLGILFYKIAEFQDLSHPVFWGAISVLLYLGAVRGLDSGLCAVLSIQIVLFITMAAWMEFNKQSVGPRYGQYTEAPGEASVVSSLQI